MPKIKFHNLMVFAILAVLMIGCNPDGTTDPADDHTPPQVEFYTYTLGEEIPNSYIVEFNTSKKFEDKIQATATYEESMQMTSAYANEVFTANDIADFEIVRTYSTAIKAVNVTINDKDLAKLINNPNVRRVEPNRIISLGKGGNGKGKPDGGGEDPPSQTTPWGTTRVGTGDGSGKTCWIIDSGIDLDHPDLNVNTTLSKSFLSGRKNTSPDDQFGHGTHVAGTVAALDNEIGSIGVAAGASVVSVRVLDRRGSGTVAGVIAGVDYAAANFSGGDVANMSLGGGASTSLDNAVLAAAASGLVFAIAAGNEYEDAQYYSPARVNHTNVYTVSAMTTGDNWASFSNYGAGVDYCQPGVGIYSTFKNGGYDTKNGTSMASPHLAGLLLLNSGTLNTDGTVNGDPDPKPDPIAVK